MAGKMGGINVHPTADIHPNVIPEGSLTVGAFTKIDAGTVISGIDHRERLLDQHEGNRIEAHIRRKAGEP